MIVDADHDPIVAFLGLGLISGSLAGALKRGNWRADLIAWGPRAPSLERGLALGLIDRFSLDLPAVVAEADVIVIGAPPGLRLSFCQSYWIWRPPPGSP